MSTHNWQKNKNEREKKKYSKLETLAFYLGKINRGLKNDNSRVYESYNKGLNNVSKNNRKPLI